MYIISYSFGPVSTQRKYYHERKYNLSQAFYCTYFVCYKQLNFKIYLSSKNLTYFHLFCWYHMDSCSFSVCSCRSTLIYNFLLVKHSIVPFGVPLVPEQFHEIIMLHHHHVKKQNWCHCNWHQNVKNFLIPFLVCWSSSLVHFGHFLIIFVDS